MGLFGALVCRVLWGWDGLRPTVPLASIGTLAFSVAYRSLLQSEQTHAVVL